MVSGEDDLIPLKWIHFQNQFIMETQKSPKYSSIVADISANEVSKSYSKTLILFRMVDWNPYSIYFFDTFLMLLKKDLIYESLCLFVYSVLTFEILVEADKTESRIWIFDLCIFVFYLF